SSREPLPNEEFAPAQLPHPELRSFIKCYRLQEVDIDTSGRWAPAWTQTFLFLNYGDVYDMMPLRGPIIRGYPAMIAGIRTLPAIGARPVVRMRAVAVELQPLAAYNWLGDKVNSIVDGSLDAGSFIPEAAALIAGIASAPFEEKCAALDKCLLPVFRPVPVRFHEGLERAMEILHRPADRSSIESRIQQAGLSSRHFRRLFKKATGVSPKLYSRILRMESVLQEFHRNPDLQYLEKVHGFYDQSHFIREFKRFTNVTPRLLIKAFKQQSIRQVHSNLEIGPDQETEPGVPGNSEP
ncbi:MAG: helix-turn-helix transcriptional regulator, partial [Leptospiraceae bacterium]|nr:helix-turn-helix transcriptional regulator [Leptospiraceae bacterium]